MAQRRVPLRFVRGGGIVDPDGRGGWTPRPSLEASVEAARKAFQAGEALYLVDLDGQFNGSANLEFLQLLERRQVFPWLDGGPRNLDHVMDLVTVGAESLTLQLRHLRPTDMEEAGGLAEIDLYVGFTTEGRGLEKGIRARDALELVSRVGATGVVFYEGAQVDLHAVENEAFEIQRVGVPVVWVARPGSPHSRHAAESLRFNVYVGHEVAP